MIYPASPRAAAVGKRRGLALRCAILGLCAVAALAAEQLPRGVAKRMVEIVWLSGDREPLASDIEVFEDGIVVIDDIDPGGRAAQLRRRDLIRLRDDLASSAFISALGHLEGEGALFFVPGVQTVSFNVGSRPEAGYHVCSDKPADPAVAKFLGDLNTAGESLFGKRFNRLPLPSPCPSMPGPRDTPKKPDAPPPQRGSKPLHYHEQILGAKIEGVMTFANSPMADQVPPSAGDRVMHARLSLDGTVVMASDTPGGQPSSGRHGFALALSYPTAAEAKSVFDALAAGGTVGMPFESTFWADGFGMLVDRPGTPWMVNGGMKPM
jgi:PhnB protein